MKKFVYDDDEKHLGRFGCRDMKVYTGCKRVPRMLSQQCRIGSWRGHNVHEVGAGIVGLYWSVLVMHLV